MSLLDYENPDIADGRDATSEIVSFNASETVVVVYGVGRPRWVPRALRVFATRENWSRVMSQTYYTWDCTHPYPKDLGDWKKKGDRCAYHPGHEDMPPLAGQRCHNCGGLRAEWFPEAVALRRTPA